MTVRPESGANSSLDTANALITTDAAVMPTSKLRTNTGSVGATSPYPMAIMNDPPTSTQIAVGSRSGASARGGVSASTTRAPSVRSARPYAGPDATTLLAQPPASSHGPRPVRRAHRACADEERPGREAPQSL